MSARNDGHGPTDAELDPAAELLRSLPHASPRPQFSESLRARLQAEAARSLTPLAMRRARRRERSPVPWLRVVAIASVAAAVAIAALMGPPAYERYRVARLPKLPAAIQEFVGAAGRYAAVKQASYTLNTTLPAAPGKLPVYAPKLGRYTQAEAEQIASALGFARPLADMDMMWRAEDTPVPGSPWLGRMLDIDKNEARVTYNDYREQTGARLTADQASANARTFLQHAGLPYHADSVTARLLTDRPQYEVELVERLSGYDALGFQSHVWVNRNGGAVVSAYFVRVTYQPGQAYPLKTAAQAFEDLKHQTVYAEHERIQVRIDGVRLAYYNWPRMNLPTEQTVMQPVYVFAGVDNYGQPFETMVPAVPQQFHQPR